MIVVGDIGGTKILAGLFESTGTLVGTQQVALPQPSHPDQVARTVMEAWEQLTRRYGRNWQDIQGGSLALPGPVASASGTVWGNAHLGWRNVRVIDVMQQAGWPAGRPLVVDDDGRLAALGEFHRGGASAVSTLVVVSIGTGVGSGVVEAGHLLQGASGGAGELGHIPVRHSDRLCRCGLVGCVETVVGGAGIADRYRERGSFRRAVSAQIVLQRAQQGDALAHEIVCQAGEALAETLVIAVHLWNPDQMIIAGGLGLAAWPVWGPMWQEALRHRVLPSHRAALQGVRPTALAGQAALLGAYVRWTQRNPRGVLPPRPVGHPNTS